MKIAAVCTDIDGTLLDIRRELSPRTISSIQKISKDIPVILASSRMPAAMRHLQKALGIPHHPLICYNGGYTVHFEGEASASQIFTNEFIPADIASSVHDLSKGTDIHVSVYHKDAWYAPRLDQWTDREQRITKVNAEITDVAAVLSGWEKNSGPHKVMCMGAENEIQIMEQQLQDRFNDQIHIYRSRPTYLELAPKIISKGAALALLLKKKYNIPMSEVLAFGDNYNDIDMVQAAGLGIAVGNARKEVKAVANEITLNSIDDGVAISIEKHLH
jgi:Cof subfamily protein (haloacid dehalogenase superfamily)